MPTTAEAPVTNGQGDKQAAVAREQSARAAASQASKLVLEIGPIVEKFLKAREEVKDEVVESDEFIDALFAGVGSRTHVYVAGEGGAGKTFGAERMGAHFATDVFYTQFRPDMKREEIFGPLSMSALQNDLYVHVTTGMLPSAYIAILDEFKDAGRFTRQLLNALNEGWFVNGNVREDIPLCTGVGTTNFWIEEQELAALFDRFAQRLVQEPVKTSEGFKKILRGQIQRDTDKANGINRDAKLTIVTLEELAFLQRHASLTTVSDAIVNEIDKLWRAAAAENLTPSPRRYGEGVRIARLMAILRGDTDVIPEDLRPLVRVLPNHPDDFVIARQLCADFKDKLSEAVDRATAALGELRTMLDPARKQLAAGEMVSDFAPLPRVQQESQAAIKKIEAAKTANGGKSNATLDRIITEIMGEQQFGQDIALGKVKPKVKK